MAHIVNLEYLGKDTRRPLERWCKRNIRRITVFHSFFHGPEIDELRAEEKAKCPAADQET